MTATPEPRDLALSDGLRRWVAAGLITPEQGDAIARFEAARPGTMPASRSHISFGAVLMYLGGFLVLLAVTFFLGISWNAYSLAGQFAWAVLAVGGLWLLGALLRRRYRSALPGNLLILAGTGAVPLLVYTLLRLTGFLPQGLTDYDTGEFQARAQATWVIIEAVSVAAAVATAALTRFGPPLLLTGVWGWLLAADLSRWLRRGSPWSYHEADLWASAMAGAVLIVAGLLAWRRRGHRFSFWCFLTGHAVLFTSLVFLGLSRDSLGLALGFLALYLAIVVASVWLQSTVFLVFGAGGTYGLICYLVLRKLHDAGSVTLGLVFIGLFVVFTGIAYQKWIEPRLLRLFGQMKSPGRRPVLS